MWIRAAVLDTDALVDAIHQFERVIKMDAPTLSFLLARAEVEVGRIYLSLGIHDESAIEEARLRFERGVSENGANLRLSSLVAGAQVGMAGQHILASIGPPQFRATGMRST